MTASAYLLPVEPVPGRLIEWENQSELRAIMHGVIGAEYLANTKPLRTPFGRIMLWSNERFPAPPVSLTSSVNHLAVYVAQISGYATMLLGPVIVTGVESNDGGLGEITLPADLSTEHLEALIVMSNGRYADALAGPAAIDASDRMLRAIHNRDVGSLTLALAEYEKINPVKAQTLRLLAQMLGIL